MERASAARMAAAKPHGWVHAALGMGNPRHCADTLNNYFIFSKCFTLSKEIFPEVTNVL